MATRIKSSNITGGAILASNLASNLKTYSEDIFTADGSTTAFTITDQPLGTNQLLVSLDGVVQPVSSYSVSGSTLTISPAVVTGVEIRAIHLGIRGNASENVVNLNDVLDVNAANPSSGQVLKWSGSAWEPATDLTGGGGGGLALTDLSVGTEAAASGNGGISYNSSTGAFTYAPPLLNELTSVGDVDFGSNKILYSNVYSTLSDLTAVSASDYHGMFAHVHATGKAYFAHGGAWIPLANESTALAYADLSVTTASASSGGSLSYNSGTGVFTYTPPDLSSYLTSVPSQSLDDLSDVSASSPSSGQVLKWNGSAWAPASDLTASGGSGISLTDLSVTVASAGSTTFAYNNTTGVFTYTPPDLSSYLTSVPAQTFSSLTGKPTTLSGYGITDAQSTLVSGTNIKTVNGSSLLGSGNIVVSGGTSYSDSDVDSHLNQSNPTSGYVLSWNGSDYAWVSNGSGSGLSDVVDDTTPQLGGNLDAQSNNITSLGTINTHTIPSGTGTIALVGDAPTHTFVLGSNGSNDYTFSDADNHWFPSTVNDPVLYLRRGETYIFTNNSGGSHPFQIRVSNGGSAYSTGVTNNGASSGNIVFKIPMGAPSTLYYQCTAHSGMGNTINIV